MKIGLIDVDGHNFPNIVLMKLSAWHKKKGDNVTWYDPFGGMYDRVYMSKVFTFTKDYYFCVNAKEIIKGGTGYAIQLDNCHERYTKDQDPSLPYEIEHIYPDYSLYPELTKDTAYGFLTRGCPRGCGFCHVKDKEGCKSIKVADLKEFRGGQNKVVLCDPNILACKEWKDLLTQLIEAKVEVDFNQGLDIRLMTEEKAQMISRLNIPRIHFAWDRYEDKNIILPKFKLFADNNKERMKGHGNIVFTLVNYNTTIEQDLDRIYTLREMGFWAYIMIYDKEHCSRTYKEMQRWVNNRFIFAKCKTFEDYNNGKRSKRQTPYTQMATLFD